jgi:hypothetical protein
VVTRGGWQEPGKLRHVSTAFARLARRGRARDQRGSRRAQENGRTSARILTDEQLADYGPWFDNHKRLRELIAELEALSLAIAEADPRWNR